MPGNVIYLKRKKGTRRGYYTMDVGFHFDTPEMSEPQANTRENFN
jgi:hypothetical protein